MRFLQMNIQITENEFQEFCKAKDILGSYEGRNILFNYLMEEDHTYDLDHTLRCYFSETDKDEYDEESYIIGETTDGKLIIAE